MGETNVDVPDMPYPLIHVWQWFRDMFNPGGVGFGPFRTTFQEIEAFARSQNVIILPREALLIRDLCGKFIEVWAAKQKETSKQPAPSSPGKPAFKRLVSMKDSAGLKDLFLGLGSRPAKPKRTS